jgi:hypothetical protein
MALRNENLGTLLPKLEQPILTTEASFDWEQREFAFSVESYGLLQEEPQEAEGERQEEATPGLVHVR